MGKSRGKKCKAHEAAIVTSIQGVDLPLGWMQQLLVLGPDLACVLAALANAGNISASQIKKARRGLPSLSAAKWTEVAPQFGLSDDLAITKLDSYPITPVLLPRLFMRLSLRRHGASKTSIKNEFLRRGQRCELEPLTQYVQL